MEGSPVFQNMKEGCNWQTAITDQRETFPIFFLPFLSRFYIVFLIIFQSWSWYFFSWQSMQCASVRWRCKSLFYYYILNFLHQQWEPLIIYLLKKKKLTLCDITNGTRYLSSSLSQRFFSVPSCALTAAVVKLVRIPRPLKSAAHVFAERPKCSLVEPAALLMPFVCRR